MNFLTIEEFEKDNVFNKKIKADIFNQYGNYISQSINDYLLQLGSHIDIIPLLQNEKYFYHPLINFILEDSIKKNYLIKGLKIISNLYYEEPNLLTFFVEENKLMVKNIDFIIENKFTTLSNNFYKYTLFKDIKLMLGTNLSIIEILELLKEDYTQNNRIVNGSELAEVVQDIINAFKDTNELHLAIKNSYYSERSIKVLLKTSDNENLIKSLDKILNMFKERIKLLNK
jgi:hypothetical protein